MKTTKRMYLGLGTWMLLIVLFCAVGARAATLAKYEFTSGSASSTGPYGSDIGFKAGISGAGFVNGRLEVDGGDTAGNAVGGAVYTDPDGARIASANWVTFSVTIPADKVVDLDSLNFDYTEIQPASFLLGVYSSRGGFTEGVHLAGFFRAGTSSSTFTDHVGASVDLSAAAFQNLSGETIEFRFLLGDDSGATSRIHVLDNIELTGTESTTDLTDVARYEFTGGSASSTGPYGSDIGFEAGISGAAFVNGRLEVDGSDTAALGADVSSYTDADGIPIASDHWVTFSVTIPAGMDVDLDSLRFDYTEIEPARFLLGVYSSKGGFTEGDHLVGFFRAGDSSSTFTDHVGASVDLSAAAYQDIGGQTIEFRFLLGDRSVATSRIHALDNIRLRGTITSPLRGTVISIK